MLLLASARMIIILESCENELWLYVEKGPTEIGLSIYLNSQAFCKICAVDDYWSGESVDYPKCFQCTPGFTIEWYRNEKSIERGLAPYRKQRYMLREYWPVDVGPGKPQPGLEGRMVYEFGPFRLAAGTRRLLREGEPVCRNRCFQRPSPSFGRR